MNLRLIFFKKKYLCNLENDIESSPQGVDHLQNRW